MITDEFAPSEQFQSDAALLCAARELSQTIYHPVGTCKMGTIRWLPWTRNCASTVSLAYVVVDASIMPQIVSGNTNAPTIMIAEKAAAMIARSGTPD